MVAEKYVNSAFDSGRRSATIDCGELPTGSSEPVQCPDVVGVSAVVAPDAHEGLSLPVFLGHPPTAGAFPGGVLRVVGDEKNTVLLGQYIGPLNGLPVCPGRHRLPKILAAALLAALQVLQVLPSEGRNLGPWNSLHLPVDIVLPGAGRAKASIASRTTSPYTVTDSLHLRAVDLSVRIDAELVLPNVNGENLPGFYFFRRRSYIGKPDPKGGVIVAECAPLKKFRLWLDQPMVESSVGLERNNDGIARDQAGDLQNVVERAFPGLNFNDQAREPNGAFKFRFARPFSGLLGSSFCGNDRFEGNLQTIRPMAVGEAPTGNPVHRLGVQPAPLNPERINITLGTGTDLPEKRPQSSPLRCGRQSERYLDRAFHGLDRLERGLK